MFFNHDVIVYLITYHDFIYLYEPREMYVPYLWLNYK